MGTTRVRGVAPRAALVLLALLFWVNGAASNDGPEGTVAVYVRPGWNLLSLPAAVTNGGVSTLFPGAWSAAFGFQHPGGYTALDPLYPGPGFWLKFLDWDTVYIQGDPVYSLTIPVQEGWNIVGCLAVPVPVASVTTDPPGIRATDFFTFNPVIGFPPVFTLMPGQGYWVQMSSPGTITLSSTTSQPCPGIPTVEWGGRTYNTVLIGDRCWLKENLDYGERIDGPVDPSPNSTVEKYCYDDNPANCGLYGALYQWAEAMQYATAPGSQGICPPGWHLPTREELDFSLRNAVGGDGNALKRDDQGIGGGLGTNTSGFSAILGGFRTTTGGFSDVAGNANFWSSTEEGGAGAIVMRLRAGDPAMLTAPLSTAHGMGVRCIRDQQTGNQPPAVPWNPMPEDGAANTLSSPTLRWSCSDPDGDPLTYDVYFGRDNLPAEPLVSDHPDNALPRFGLADGATYHWKVVASDGRGPSTVGPEWSFTTQSGGGTPCPGTPTVTYSGKTYTTVQIGTQCWLRENLDIGTMVIGTGDQTNNSVMEKYCFGNDPSNCNTYGGLYQWGEAMQYETPPEHQGICPPGWHIPTLAEFQTLSSTVVGDGNTLKAIGQGTGAGAGTNTSGFYALLAGQREFPAGSFHGLGDGGFFWSSTESDATGAHLLWLGDNDASILLGTYHKAGGFSIRCLKD